MIYKNKVIHRRSSRSRGFTLLVAIIFMSVMLSFALELASVSQKQAKLTESATGAQAAFYAADAGLECLLYAEYGGNNVFMYPQTGGDPGVAPPLSCPGLTPYGNNVPDTMYTNGSNPWWVLTYRFTNSTNGDCIDLLVSKYKSGAASLYAQGYDVPCSSLSNPSASFTARGIWKQHF